MKTAIIDFNRTLWNPDTNNLIPGAQELLQLLKGKEIKLALISAASDKKERQILIKSISSFFDVIKVVSEKSPQLFEEIIQNFNTKPTETIVIGDRIKGDINIGNRLGMKTIRLKAGKYAQEEPLTKNENPNYSFTSLREITTFLNETILRSERP